MPRPSRSLLFALACIGSLTVPALSGAAAFEPLRVASPDGRLVLTFTLTADGAPRYAIARSGTPVLRPSRLGLVRDDADFTTGLRAAGTVTTHTVEDRFEILTAKRRLNLHRASEAIVPLQTAGGARLDVQLRVADDGFAFRYVFPETRGTTHRVREEVSSFHLPEGAEAWLQPMAVARSGWAESNPSYEEYYTHGPAAGLPCTTGAGWVFPALFRAGDTWLLLSEAGLGRTYCGTRLRSGSPDGEYTIGFPDPREARTGGPALPESTLPWTTPWRLGVVGGLGTVVESMLGVDLAEPPAVAVDPAAILPGHAAWSWPLLGDPNTTFEVQKRFIDYAADMHWRYCLIDALWDTQIGYDKLAELVAYARTRDVRILVWYNSAGDWNTTPQTPRGLLLTPEGRAREFARLHEIGVAGLKIDFFGGDGQSMIAYYHDLLTDAAPHGFLLNFHGATLPRGWHRTYPHLMTMEAVRGLEFVTFEQANADRQPAHCAMLPFARNVFDPMDFTPVVLDRIRNIERRTTAGFELALSVLYTSGIQHFAEIPEGMAKAPDDVRAFLRDLPAVWDDVRFLDGFPGEFAVLARRAGSRWYVAGVHAGEAPRDLALDLAGLGATRSAVVISDGSGEGAAALQTTRPALDPKSEFTITLGPRGGFVAVLE